MSPRNSLPFSTPLFSGDFAMWDKWNWKTLKKAQSFCCNKNPAFLTSQIWQPPHLPMLCRFCSFEVTFPPGARTLQQRRCVQNFEDHLFESLLNSLPTQKGDESTVTGCVKEGGDICWWWSEIPQTTTVLGCKKTTINMYWDIYQYQTGNSSINGKGKKRRHSLLVVLNAKICTHHDTSPTWTTNGDSFWIRNIELWWCHPTQIPDIIDRVRWS